MEYALVNDEFGHLVAKKLNLESREFKDEYYPDGEPCTRILADYEELTDRDILVISRLKSPMNTFGILSYLHTLNRVTNNLTSDQLYNARNVDVILPYFVLGRQNHNPRIDPNDTVRKRDKGKDIGYWNILIDFEARGVKRILTFTPHFHRSDEEKRIFCDVDGRIEIQTLPGVNALADYFKGKIETETIIINPDMAADKLAADFAQKTGASSRSGLKKERITEQKVSFKETLDVDGKDVIIIDDVASTGTTLFGSINSLINVNRISIAIVHAVLPDMSTTEKGYGLIQRLLEEKRIEEFVATDTIDSEYGKASIIDDVVNFYKIHK